MEPKYDHLKVESNIYDQWVNKGYFTAGDVSLFAATSVYAAMMFCGFPGWITPELLPKQK